MYLIILAAGRGSRLYPLTKNKPKCLVEVDGKPIIDHLVNASLQAGLQDIVVVSGYKNEMIDNENILKIVNENYDTTNMVQTLMCAEKYFNDEFIMSYGDIIYSYKILRSLKCSNNDITVVVDKDWENLWKERFADPLSDAETLKIDNDGFLSEIGKKTDDIINIEAQYIGLVHFNKNGIKILKKYYKMAKNNNNQKKTLSINMDINQIFMTDLIQSMIEGGEKIKAYNIHGGWFEIDSIKDLEIADSHLKKMN